MFNCHTIRVNLNCATFCLVLLFTVTRKYSGGLKINMYNNEIDHNYGEKRLYYTKGKLRSLMMKFPSRIHINEWTFSFSLFIVSLTIVIVKLLFIYGNDIPFTLEHNLSSLTNLKIHFYSVDLKMATSDINYQYANETLFYSKQIDEYKKVAMQTMMKISDECGWLMKAISSGLGILGFTWFIVYKDSNIPGINPPSPFSPSKKRLAHSSIIQMNYLIGIINGILIFIYMCLQ